MFTIYDIGIQWLRRGCRGLKGVTGGYKGLQGVTGGYKGDYINFFLGRTFPNTFSWSIFHKIKVKEILNF